MPCAFSFSRGDVAREAQLRIPDSASALRGTFGDLSGSCPLEAPSFSGCAVRVCVSAEAAAAAAGLAEETNSLIIFVPA